MAKKKNNSKIFNQLFLNLAFQQAEINLGFTKSNPSVGCIVEKDGSTISSGFTYKNGRPHAETVALKKNKDFKNANLYVTLEPCVHYGKTPPCVNLIKKKNIKNVFFSLNDPDVRTKNLAKNFLIKNGVNCFSNFKKTYGKKFYESYILKHKKKIPLIDSKIAFTKDFFSINKKNKFVTNFKSRRTVHLLRSKYDCILSTSKTINKDDSKLDVRIEGLENKSPDIIIIDRKLKLNENLSLFKIHSKRKIIIFTEIKKNIKINKFKKKGIKIYYINRLIEKNDFIIMFMKISQLGYSRVFCETGVTLLKFLIKNKFIHNLYAFQSPYKVRKYGLNKLSAYTKKNINIKNKIKVNLKDDKLYKINFK